MEDCNMLENASDVGTNGAESLSSASITDSLSATITEVNKLIIIGL